MKITLDAEDLAILLACSTKVADPMPANRLACINLWRDLKKSMRLGYLRRAERLIRAWGAA